MSWSQKDLRDMWDRSTSKGVVRKWRGVETSDVVVVGCPAVIVTRKQGVKGDDTIRVGLLSTSQKGTLVICKVRGVSISLRDKTGIDTSSVANPDFSVEIRNGLACIDIDVLLFHNYRHSRLAFPQLRTDSFSGNPVRPGLSLQTRTEKADFLVRTFGNFLSRRWGSTTSHVVRLT